MIRILKYWVLLFIFFVLNETPLSAQNDSNFQIWTDFNPRLKLTDQFKLIGDIGYRIEPSSAAQTFLIRAAIRYEANRIIGVDAGLGTFNTWDTDFLNSFEFRTYEYLFVNWPNLWGFQFRNRIGLDQRWYKFHQLDLNEFEHRARIRIGIKSPEFNLFKCPFKFYTTGNVEFLRDINDEELSAIIDHNRFMLGMGSQINTKLRTELQFQVIGLHDRQLSTIIRDVTMIRVRVFYTFK